MAIFTFCIAISLIIIGGNTVESTRLPICNPGPNYDMKQDLRYISKDHWNFKTCGVYISTYSCPRGTVFLSCDAFPRTSTDNSSSVLDGIMTNELENRGVTLVFLNDTVQYECVSVTSFLDLKAFKETYKIEMVCYYREKGKGLFRDNMKTITAFVLTCTGFIFLYVFISNIFTTFQNRSTVVPLYLEDDIPTE